MGLHDQPCLLGSAGKHPTRVKSSGIIHQSQTWEQFRSLVATLPTTKAKGDAFEALCSAFLRSDPRHAVRTISEIVNH